MLGIIFSWGFIHIWCSGGYLLQQEGVHGTHSKLTTVPAFIVMPASAMLGLISVLLIELIEAYGTDQ